MWGRFVPPSPPQPPGCSRELGGKGSQGPWPAPLPARGGSAQGMVTTAGVPRWLQVPQPGGASTGLAPCTSYAFFSLRGSFLVSTWKEDCLCSIHPCFSSISWSMAGPHGGVLGVRATPRGERVFRASSALRFGSPWRGPIPVGETGRGQRWQRWPCHQCGFALQRPPDLPSPRGSGG